MKKINTHPLSGMQEFLPAEQAIYDTLRSQIFHVYRVHGFMPIETPAIERLEVLLAKAGGDTEKQIYQVCKTAEQTIESSEGLRFDHTVPLARYVIEHQGQLTFPFKVMQIGRSWRGERAQKGRFREFEQCDIDIISRGDLSLAYDAEVITTLLEAFSKLALTTPVIAHISNRKILIGFLRALGLAEKSSKICNIIDHADKISPEEIRLALIELGLSETNLSQLLHFINLHGSSSEIFSSLNQMSIDDEMFLAGLSELRQITDLLDAEKLTSSYVLDFKIVRGLDYYTGTVFEFTLSDYPNIGSVGGGGRYDNLASNFSDQQFPGVGGSIGLSRLFYLIQEHNLTKSQRIKPLDYAVIPLSDQQAAFANQVARTLRNDGQIASVIHLNKSLSKRLAYAARLADNAIVLGEEEARTKKWQTKHFD